MEATAKEGKTVSHESYYAQSPLYAALYERFGDTLPWWEASNIAYDHGITTHELESRVEGLFHGVDFVSTLEFVKYLGY